METSPPDSNPWVHIVVLNWNGYELTRDCLNSLREVSYPDLRVTVVDNGSTDGSYERLTTEFPSVEIVRSERNLGFAGGNNFGVRHAASKYAPGYFLLLNNDTVVDKNFVTELVGAFVAKKVGIAGSKIYYHDDPRRIWYAGGRVSKWSGEGTHIGIGELDTGQYNQVSEVDFVTGCCLMMSSRVVEDIGLLDERFFAYCEDLDYSLRASEKGYSILQVPGSVLYHRVSSSFKTGKSTKFGGRSKLAYYLNVRNRIFIYRKHRSRISALGFTLFQIRFVIRYLIGFTLSFNFEKVKSVFDGIWDGCTMELADQPIMTSE